MKHRRIEILRTGMLVLSAVLFAALVWVLWRTIPWSAVRYGILGLCAAIFAVVGLWAWYQRRQVSLFPTTCARRSTPCFPAGSRRTISPTRTA